MFDVGISELGVIGLVALIVIGPEQLPRVARTAGHLMGRLRRYVADVKSDISREMEAADLQRLSDEVRDSARSLETSLREQVAGIEAQVQQVTSEVHELATNVVAQVEASDEPAASGEPAEGPAHVEALHEPSTPVEGAAEIPVDPNQMDLFGAPAAGSAPLPEKH